MYLIVSNHGAANTDLFRINTGGFREAGHLWCHMDTRYRHQADDLTRPEKQCEVHSTIVASNHYRPITQSWVHRDNMDGKSTGSERSNELHSFQGKLVEFLCNRGKYDTERFRGPQFAEKNSRAKHGLGEYQRICAHRKSNFWAFTVVHCKNNV